MLIPTFLHRASARSVGILRGHLDSAEHECALAQQRAKNAEQRAGRFEQLLIESNARTQSLAADNHKLRSENQSLLRLIELQGAIITQGKPAAWRGVPVKVITRNRFHKEAGMVMCSRLFEIGGRLRRFALADFFQRDENAKANAAWLLDVVETLVLADAGGLLNGTVLKATIDEGREVLQEVYCPRRGTPAGVVHLNALHWQEVAPEPEPEAEMRTPFDDYHDGKQFVTEPDGLATADEAGEKVAA